MQRLLSTFVRAANPGFLTALAALAVVPAHAQTLELDTTPPTVTITSPASESTVSGTVTVTADASDDTGVAGVQFFVDGSPLGAEQTTAPYSIEWDTTTVRDGSYTVTADARDAAGNTATSSPVTVTVANSSVPAAGPTRLEEDAAAIAYTGTWYDRFSPGFSQGKVKGSPHAGSRATLTFTGTGVAFIGYRAINTGILRVYLDGKPVADVDTFSPAPLFQQPLYVATGLARGTHTLAIEVTGTYSVLVGSAWIAVDAFDVVP